VERERTEAVAPTKVFLDYTQEELDRAYDQRAWAPNAEALIASGPVMSAETRKRLKFTSHNYGATRDETLDVFPASAANAPVAIFIHGGAWRAQTKEDVSFVAEAFVPSGVHCVVLNFDNIPEARIPDMAEKIRRGVVWTYKNAVSFGGDPGRLHVLGHSSGGHLSSVMLTTDWTKYGVPARLFRSGLVASGMYDLEAPMLSARAHYAKVTQEEEHALSAMRHLDPVHCPIIIAYGDKESPEFQRHGRDFAAALKQAGLAHELHIGPGLNHFEVMHSMSEPNGFLRTLALRLVGAAVPVWQAEK
jgi:arylformamidase